MYYFIAILVIGLIIFLLNKKLKSDSSSLSNVKRTTIEKIKNTGTVIELDANNCEVVKNDTILKHGYYQSSSAYGLKFLKRAKYRVEDRYQVQSLLICRYVNSKGIKNKFVKQVNMDSTLLRVKINMQKKINISVNNMDSDDYYIDLDFLYS